MTALHDPEQFIQGVLSGNRRILAKTITLIESSLPNHQELSRIILDRLLPYTGNAIRLGISGIPGSGKSTFIESLGILLTQQGHRVAVLAVDPSSKRSGGSVLADKTRMEKLAANPAAFIRPSPSGGTLGGVALKTREAAFVCEAAGFDVIIIETVGVGQSETTVAAMVDFFLLLLIAGAGDELQGMKKGILELIDAVVINKADGDNIPKALEAQRAYASAMHFLVPSTSTWTPPVLTCSALEMKGIDTIWETVLEHRKKMMATGEFEEKRRRQAIEWMWSMIDYALKERFNANPAVKKQLGKISRSVKNGLLSPTTAAQTLLNLFEKKHF
ncbi:MAG: methylmalonyl Co-A mutase-associated GTPase MeaB [Desulfobacterota bacterium]|nr:methylmalonyl Co-A mutase-associated GTPase MeaB [Thermodesulfobacteriota bacterium]